MNIDLVPALEWVQDALGTAKGRLTMFLVGIGSLVYINHQSQKRGREKAEDEAAASRAKLEEARETARLAEVTHHARERADLIKRMGALEDQGKEDRERCDKDRAQASAAARGQVIRPRFPMKTHRSHCRKRDCHQPRVSRCF